MKDEVAKVMRLQREGVLPCCSISSYGLTRSPGSGGPFFYIRVTLILSKRKYADRSIIVTANPGLQFVVIFKNINAHRVTFAG